jgi:hypothetical protein
MGDKIYYIQWMPIFSLDNQEPKMAIQSSFFRVLNSIKAIITIKYLNFAASF